MTDIVERLRALPETFCGCCDPESCGEDGLPCACLVFADAADEIERLRAELREPTGLEVRGG